MQRREFLKWSGAGALSAGLPLPLVHGGGSGRVRRGDLPIVVSIYLRGGQDALNTLVPYGDRRYYEMRPTIAIPAKAQQANGAVIELDDTFGLHPALAAWKPLWDRKVFAPIVCAGSPHRTRSHFDAQDFMEYAAPGMRTVRDGWLNRYLTLTTAKDGDPELRSIGMQGLLPRALRGSYPVLAVPRDRTGGQLLDEFEMLYGQSARDVDAKQEGGGQMNRRGNRGRKEPQRRPDEVKAMGRATVKALRRYQEIIRKAPESKVAYPKGGFGKRMRNIARVIRAGEPLQVVCADYTGWDHHTDEGGLEGVLAPKLEILGDSIAAFIEDIGADFERTAIVIMTEFGRTCAENGNAGTDHGHGGLMCVFGGKVRGGRVIGDWTGLEENDLYQGRDLRVTTDFREVMGELLQVHMGTDLPKGFFPGYKLAKKGLGLFGA